MSFDPELAGHLISRHEPPLLDVFGPTVVPLTAADEHDRTAPAVLRGTIPPGVSVPMHAHSMPETFYVMSGRLEGLAVREQHPVWTPLAAGQIFHIPPNARHAFRNAGDEPAVALIISTPPLVEFFEHIGIELPSDDAPRRPPTAAELERFLEFSAERGYWNATPEENAEVGIELPPPPPDPG